MVVLKLVFVCVTLCELVCGSAARGEQVQVKLFEAAAEFDVDTTVLVAEAGRAAREAGYKLRAALAVAPVWTDSTTQYLLQFQLKSPKLHLRGKHINAEFQPKKSIWDSHAHSTFYAFWNHGVIEKAYLNPDDQQDILNYKKSLISLFQFQMLDVEHNETDISGTCETSYESLSPTVIRKIKKRCVWEGGAELESAVTSQRLTRYTLGSGGELRGVLAEELHVLRAARLDELALKARAWHELARAAAAPAPAAPAPSLQEALLALPTTLQPLPLVMQHMEQPDDDMELSSLVERHRAALRSEGAGAGGDAGAARAVLELLPALQAATAPRLQALLQDDSNHEILLPLCRLAGAAGAASGLAAARGALQLEAREPLLAPALAYLAGLARAERPDPGLGAAVLRLAGSARGELREAAALAGAAASRRQPQPARDLIAAHLARCKDEDCKVMWLRALGNLGSAASLELLLQHGTELQGGAAARAALRALDALPPAALHFRAVGQLLAAALLGRRLPARAAALDLAARRSLAAPAALHAPAHELRAAPAELRRVFWQRLRALAAQHEHVAAVLRLFSPALSAWHEAAPGCSSVLALRPGLRAWGWQLALDSVQVAQAGVLRQGSVTLLARPDQPGEDVPLLELELWTRGLESVAGAAPAGGEDADEGEDMAAGLALSAAGVRLPPITLFESQAELLGHVWSGAGSTATPVLRAEGGAGRRGGLALGAGVWLEARGGVAAAGAVDAQAQVSLWARSASLQLQVRGALAAQAMLRVRTAWGAARAELRAAAAPRLTLRAQLDFYSQPPLLCLRLYTDDMLTNRTVSLDSQQGASQLRVSRSTSASHVTPGRTLALGADNSAACRALPDNSEL